MNEPPIDQHFADNLRVLLEAVAQGKAVVLCFVVDGECRTLLQRAEGGSTIPALGAMAGQCTKTAYTIAKDWERAGGPTNARSLAAFNYAKNGALSDPSDELRLRAHTKPHGGEDLEQ